MQIIGEFDSVQVYNGHIMADIEGHIKDTEQRILFKDSKNPLRLKLRRTLSNFTFLKISLWLQYAKWVGGEKG